MPHIYCTRCRQPQTDNERVCRHCGARFGGSLWILLLGVLLAIGGPLFVSHFGRLGTGSSERAILQALFYWILPILIGTLCLYDSNGRRVTAYLYCGGAIVVAGVIMLN